MTTNYARGAAFERRVKQDMEKRGYFSMRSPRSGGLVDIFSYNYPDRAFFIQAKRNGRLSVKDHQALVSLAEKYGAQAVLAEPRNLTGPRRSGIRYFHLLINDEGLPDSVEFTETKTR